MHSKVSSLFKKYIWLFPLIVVTIGIIYFINLFERIYTTCTYLVTNGIFRELEIAIGIMLLITAILNWALVGFWKYTCSGSCKVTRKVR